MEQVTFLWGGEEYRITDVILRGKKVSKYHQTPHAFDEMHGIHIRTGNSVRWRRADIEPFDGLMCRRIKKQLKKISSRKSLM